MSDIHVISTSTIVQAKSATTKNHFISRIELTPWDLQLLMVDSIQKGLLFHKPSPQTTHEFFGTNLIDHLKISLSRTLDFFPLLAGRLATTTNDDNTKSIFIDCNNKGAQFVHAIVHGLKVADILDSVYVPSIVHSFFPLNGVCNYNGISKPLLAVQVTELDDGFFIGCTINHCVGDGTSFWHFFNSWSEISSGFSYIAKPPILTRWFPEGVSFPIRISFQEEKALEKYIPPPLQERVFHFSKENITKLKARANLEIGTERISSLQAVLAHLWRSVIRCRRCDADEKVSLKLLIGARSRLKPFVTDNYYGNAVHIAPITTTASKLLKNGLGWIAWEMNKMIASQTDEKIKTFYKDWVKRPEIVNKSEVYGANNSLVISSSPRFNVYGTDFGWGKPLGVRSGMGNKSDGKITVFQGVDEGSIDIEACLAPETLHAMGNDAEFIEAVTI